MFLLYEHGIVILMKRAKEISKDILNFNAVFLEETDGGYSVMVPSLPGCFSQGDTFEGALGNIKEAISLYLEEGTDDIKTYHPKREFMAPVSL